MKHKYELKKKLSFQCVSEATVRKAVKSLPSNKATTGEIPVNVLKNCESCFFVITNCIYEAFRNNMFPDSIKLSDITAVYKKLDPSDKANYRLVSVYHYYQKYLKKLFMIYFMNI